MCEEARVADKDNRQTRKNGDTKEKLTEDTDDEKGKTLLYCTSGTTMKHLERNNAYFAYLENRSAVSKLDQPSWGFVQDRKRLLAVARTMRFGKSQDQKHKRQQNLDASGLSFDHHSLHHQL